MRAPFKLAGEIVPPGQRRIIDIPLSMMSDHTPATLSVQVLHGVREGPTLFVSAAIHGDEIIGVEVVRRLAQAAALKRIAGTILLIPIVNAFGFIGQSRYLPDRRDLNRSFPGSESGSLASQLAYRFLNDIVARCDYGIDLHSAAIHRVNFPQIRINPQDKMALELAQAFSPPVILHSSLREGSLRKAAWELDVPVLVYEAGEALRFDEYAIRVGLKGVLKAMKHLRMISTRGAEARFVETPVVTKSIWVRAPAGGILRTLRTVGDSVAEGELIGLLSDPFGEMEMAVVATAPGIIVGRTNLPVINQGDALFHIAILPRNVKAGDVMDAIEQDIAGDPLTDEDQII